MGRCSLNGVVSSPGLESLCSREQPHTRISLVVRETSTGILIWVRTKKETCDRFGWTEHFDTELQHRLKQSPNGIINRPNRARFKPGAGKPMKLLTVRNRHAPPRGSLITFRVAIGTTLFDTAELAHFTGGDWHWMTSRDGQWRSRDEWEAMYRAGEKDTLRRRD